MVEVSEERVIIQGIGTFVELLTCHWFRMRHPRTLLSQYIVQRAATTRPSVCVCVCVSQHGQVVRASSKGCGHDSWCGHFGIIAVSLSKKLTNIAPIYPAV